MIQEIIQAILAIPLTNEGSNTQATSSNHEGSCFSIFQRFFQPITLSPGNFRSFIRQNGYNLCGHSDDSLNRSCIPSIPITNNSLNLEIDQNYMILQPAGSQNFPDGMMVRLDGNNNLQMVYIECKQLIPKFNNNPPKMNKNCIYICGNKIFNGYLLTTPEWQDKKDEFIRRYNLLAEEFTTEDMRIVPYRVIEPRWIGDRGTQCFIDREEQNIPLIDETLSRFY